jgi:hypothetical protein
MGGIVDGSKGSHSPDGGSVHPAPLGLLVFEPTKPEVIAEAERVLAEADSRLFLTGGARVLSVADFLRDGLEIYAALEADRLHPASVFPEVPEWPLEDALRQALESAAADIASDTCLLARVIAEAEASCDDVADPACSSR